MVAVSTNLLNKHFDTDTQYIGFKSGMLTVIAPHKYRDINRNKLFLCKCECGVELLRRANEVLNGKAKACGCTRPDKFTFKHGYSDTPEYYSWNSLKSRCLNPNDVNYANYGGRGIKVCDAWANNFMEFLADMGFRPSVEMSIERIDPNGDYCPSNCKWATTAEQGANKRDNLKIELNGEIKSAAEWDRLAGHKSGRVDQRLREYKMTIEDAIYKDCSNEFLLKYPRK